MKIVGIDFGHGETSAGYVDSATAIGHEIYMQDLKVSGDKTVIPSIILRTSTGEYVIDPSTNQIAKAAAVGIYFKAPIVGNSLYERITDENKEFFRDFLSTVYSSIVGNPNNPLHVANDIKDFEVYIACPSGWDDVQIQAYKEFVRDECHIPLVDIVKESRAAYIAARRKVGGGIRNQGGNVLVIDFGSSTVDFTYFNNDSRFEPVHEGYPYGASQVEKDILEYLKKNVLGVKKHLDLVIERYGKTRALNTILFAIRKQKEEYFSQANVDSFNLSIHLREILLDRNLTGFYIEPEEPFAKKLLIEEILKNYIASLSEMLDDFAKKDGVASIDKVILTGGASRMFFFRDLVSEKYNVSKQDDTLIIDLDPSVTISQGIAAFGYMNEESKAAEEPLWNDLNEWLNNIMPQLLKKTIETCIGDMYYSEFSQITSRYGTGHIVKEGKHNLDGLEDEIIALLNQWTAGGEAMSKRINEVVEENMMSSIGEKITEFANTWAYDTAGFKFDINLNLNIQASLTTETCQGLIHYMWQQLKEFIDKRDFWGWDDDTSPFKDRNSDDRKSIEKNLNKNFRSFFNDLNYISPLDDEILEIRSSVMKKVQDFVDNAKLQQYK